MIVSSSNLKLAILNNPGSRNTGYFCVFTNFGTASLGELRQWIKLAPAPHYMQSNFSRQNLVFRKRKTTLIRGTLHSTWKIVFRNIVKTCQQWLEFLISSNGHIIDIYRPHLLALEIWTVVAWPACWPRLSCWYWSDPYHASTWLSY